MTQLTPTSIPVPASGVEPEGLDVLAQLVWTMVDGNTTVAELGECCGVDEELAFKIVGDLSSRGLVSLRQGSSAPPGGATGPSEKQMVSEPQAPVRDVTIEVEADSSQFAVEIREVYNNLDSSNYYDLLAVDPDVDRKKLRNVYFTLSKKFHPDKAFGPSKDELREKMEVIFRNLTQAYDVLSTPAQRQEYDAYIADQIELWKIEKQLQEALNQERDSQLPPEPGVATTSDRPSGQESPTRIPPRKGPVVRTTIHPRRTNVQSSSSRTATRRPPKSVGPQQGARKKPVSDRPSKPADKDAVAARREKWKRERMGRALGMSLPTTSTPPPPAKRNPGLEEDILQAEIALEQQEFADATRLLHAVLEVEPENTRARVLMEKAKAGSVSALVKGYLRQGRYERKQGLFDKAVATIERAMEADSRSLEARHLLADTLLESRRQLPRALSLCKELVAMGGQRARYFATLGELLLLAGEKARAGNAFDRALTIEPDNFEYRKKLKACKG